MTTMLCNYGHDFDLDFGPPQPNKKFRWVIQVFNEGKRIAGPAFTVIGNRPTSSLLDYPPHSSENDFSFSYEKEIDKFDKLILTLHDGCGNLVETWEMSDIKKGLTGESYYFPGGEVEEQVLKDHCLTYKRCDQKEETWWLKKRRFNFDLILKGEL